MDAAAKILEAQSQVRGSDSLQGVGGESWRLALLARGGGGGGQVTLREATIGSIGESPFGTIGTIGKLSQPKVISSPGL